MDSFDDVKRLTAPYTVRVTLEGFPEHVQEVANALDLAIPDMFDWHDCASVNDKAEIVLKGSTEREFGNSKDGSSAFA